MPRISKWTCAVPGGWYRWLGVRGAVSWCWCTARTQSESCSRLQLKNIAHFLNYNAVGSHCLWLNYRKIIVTVIILWNETNTSWKIQFKLCRCRGHSDCYMICIVKCSRTKDLLNGQVYYFKYTTLCGVQAPCLYMAKIRYCKTKTFHLQLIFTISTEANLWKLKVSKMFTLVMI